MGTSYGSEVGFTTPCPPYDLHAQHPATVSCYGGDDGWINVTLNGFSEPFSYSWNDEVTTQNRTNLSPGAYTVTVTDANGCQTSPHTIEIGEPSQLTLVIDNVINVTCTGCLDGSIYLTASGGTPEYSYSWTGPDYFTSDDEDLNLIMDGTYNVIVTDANGCNESISAEVYNPLKVTNTHDVDEIGSFRHALNYANGHEGTDEIIFDISGEGPFTLQPSTTPLPPITDPVIIDGFSQPGASESNSILLIELDGESAGIGSNGLTLASDNCEIKGLVINRFSGSGIYLDHANDNIVESNFIGTDITGKIGLGNGSYNETEFKGIGAGISLYVSSNNTIGGSSSTKRNLISANPNNGIWIIGYYDKLEGVYYKSSGNLIKGNLIGTDIEGIAKLENRYGIKIDTSINNVIGGLIPEERNIISGNIFGIYINGGDQAKGNSIIGNYIGTDITGTQALGNGWGINLSASETLVGGSTPGARNLICGSPNTGLGISGNLAHQGPTTGNIIQGNYVGVDVNGNNSIPNDIGIMIMNSGGNQIGGNLGTEGNLISGNYRIGLYVGYMDATDNMVEGNLIGTTADGKTALGNGIGQEDKYGFGGININGPGNNIGSTDPQKRNIISGNLNGLTLRDSADNCIILGNYIGTDISGAQTIPNLNNGIAIKGGKDNTIGGSTPNLKNIISGNLKNGIVLTLSDVSETNPQPPEISTGNLILGNFIGTNATGDAPLGNMDSGIEIQNGASDNTIGSGNLISGNVFAGVVISGELTTGNIVTDNLIGTDYTGNSLISNGDDGVHISDAPGNTVSGNVLCGAGRGGVGNNGIEILGSNANNNIITGNYIGTNSNSDPGLGNGFMGIQIKRDAHHNTIGPDNVISGNLNHGILIERDNSQGQGTSADYNTIFGNRIGTSVEGTAPLGNYGCGIMIKDYASNNTIGPENLISGNYNSGVQILGEYSVGNEITSNSIYSNGGLGIDLGGDGVTQNDIDEDDIDIGPNNLQNFPVIESLSFSPGNVNVSGYLNSKPEETYTLQFFANKVPDNYEIGGESFGEGQTFIGSTEVTTDKKGEASFIVTLTTSAQYGDVITTSATDPERNTSEFSAAMGGLQNQILAGDKIPFEYKINQSDVVKTDYTIPYTTIKSEVDKAFSNWTGINTSIMSFKNMGKTNSRYASATDNTNLVSFTDDQFPFSPGVLAVSAKTLKILPNSSEAQIIDADIVVNPYYINHQTWDLGIEDNTSYPGFFDIQSILTHEIGHVMGLIHSGVYNSVMWFEIGPGTDNRTLKQDDKSWLSYRYPDENYDDNFGSISGNIKYGYEVEGENPPVAGAIVLAMDPESNLPVVHAYSDADGNYLIPGLPPGDYNVYITPLDGSVYGRPLGPGNISSYIYCNTIYTDYPGEFYNDPDGPEDDKDATPTTITVSAGQEEKNKDFITNVDKTPPEVESVVPANTSSDISVSSSIVITFSEPVDISTITDASCYLETNGTKIEGDYKPKVFDNNPNMIQLTPPNSLAFNITYDLYITTDITDLRGNNLDPGDHAHSTFTTIKQDEIFPTIKGTVPKDGAKNVFLSDKIMVYFSESMIKSTVENSFSLTSDAIKVDCSTSWDEYNTFTLTPNRPLKEGKTYELAWTEAGTDLFGNNLAPGSISFGTIKDAAPEVIYLEPGGSDAIYEAESYLTSNVSVETSIVADFSEPINTKTIKSASTFILHEGNQTGTIVPGTFEFLEDNSRVIFRPDVQLKFGQNYTIELTGGIADVSSTVHYLTGLTATFTTAEVPKTPHISYLNPYAGKAGSYVTIVGTGFDPNPANNVVKFNDISTGIQATVKDASLTNLTVIVPPGAISGPVTITVNKKSDDQVPNNYVTYFYFVPLSDPKDAATANYSTVNRSRDGVMDFNGARAFITNPDDNTVSVIENLDSDPTLNETPIQVGTTPMKIAINPEGTLIYVTNYNSDDVSVIDISNNSDPYQVVSTINVGSHPLGIVASSDGKVYVANDQTVSVINVDPSSGGFDHAVANINTGTRNRDGDITADAAILVVTGNNGLNIIKISKTNLGFDYGVYNVNPGTPTRDVTIPVDAGTAIVTTESGNIFLVDIVPGSDNFGTAYANYNPNAKAGDGKISFDGLYYWVTNPYDDQVTVYELFYGGGPSSSNPSNPSGLNLKEHTVIPVLGQSPEGIYIETDNDKVLTINDGSITLIANNVTPQDKTITDLVKDIAIALQTMIKENAIQESLGNMLINKLNDASNYIISGKTKTAINMLNAFIDKVNDLDADGMISNAYPHEYPDAVEYLIDTAEEIIRRLETGTKSAKEETFVISTDLPQSDLIPETGLGAIYPNPSKESVTINYDVADNELNGHKVTLLIYDVLGRVVGELANGMYEPGHYSVTWNGFYENGRPAPKGIYYLRFVSGDIKVVKRVMLVR